MASRGSVNNQIGALNRNAPPSRPEPKAAPTPKNTGGGNGYRYVQPGRPLSSRPAPKARPKPVSRPAASRENRPNAVAANPAARIALLQQLAGAFSTRYEDGSTSNPVLRGITNLVAGSPVGAGVGNVVARQTWDKLAPLFSRKGSEAPTVSFGRVPKGTAAFASKGSVKVGQDALNSLFSGKAGPFKGLLAHEYAHTQQAPARDFVPSTDPGRKGQAYSPIAEGGADAFKNLVAPLLHYYAQPPSDRTDYGRAQLKNYMSGTDDSLRYNLPKALIQQFPRVKQRSR